MNKYVAAAAAALAIAVAGCSSLPAPLDELGPEPTAPVLTTWDEEDPGDPSSGQYPAVLVHYSADWQEDDAGEHCETQRGGSLIDWPGERFVCLVD